LQHLRRKAMRLRSENEAIARAIGNLGVACAAARAEPEEAGRGQAPPERADVGVKAQVEEFPVVETRAPERSVIERESEPADQMEPQPVGDAEARYVAGIGRDLGVDQSDVEQRAIRIDLFGSIIASSWHGLAFFYCCKPTACPLYSAPDDPDPIQPHEALRHDSAGILHLGSLAAFDFQLPAQLGILAFGAAAAARAADPRCPAVAEGALLAARVDPQCLSRRRDRRHLL